MKCKCIKESKWYCIDDSDDKSNHGGQYEYIVDEIYECELLYGVKISDGVPGSRQ